MEMMRTLFVEDYCANLADFMRGYVFAPWTFFDIWTLALFWIPCILFVALLIMGLFQPKRHLLSLRRCVILLGSVCALWGLHFASGVLFIFTCMEPEHYADCMIWGVGIGYMIRGAILLILASLVVCQNLLFRKKQEGETS